MRDPDGPKPELYRASLLDRLISDDPRRWPRHPWKRLDEPAPLRRQTRAEFERSLLRDIEHLFNTRSVALEARAGGDLPTVIEFGVRDTTALHPASNIDRKELATRLREAIDAFEPRLRVRHIEVAQDTTNPRRLIVYFDLLLVAERVPERVSLTAYLDTTSGEFAINGAR